MRINLRNIKQLKNVNKIKEKAINIIFIGFIMTNIIGCGKSSSSPDLVESEAKKIYTTSIEDRSLNNIYQSDIIITPRSKVDHKTETKGTIVSILKKNGDLVKKGEVVIKLTKAEVESEYKSATANLESSKILLDAAANNFEKYSKLFEMGLVSEIDFLNFKTSFSDAKANYLTQKANFENKKDTYDKLTRVSLLDGKIGNLFSKEGNDVAEDENLFTVIDESAMEGYVEFSGNLYNNIKEGDEVKVEIADLKNKSSVGTVTEINPVANPETKKFKMKLSIKNGASEIKDGMYGKVSIAFENKKGLIVPQSSVLTKSLSSYIYIVEEGIAKKISVERGIINEPFIEVISKEIKPGDRVVYKGTFGLNGGDKVIEITQKED